MDSEIESSSKGHSATLCLVRGGVKQANLNMIAFMSLSVIFFHHYLMSPV